MNVYYTCVCVCVWGGGGGGGGLITGMLAGIDLSKAGDWNFRKQGKIYQPRGKSYKNGHVSVRL